MGYYQGDFYRGDPGFFSVLGRIGKSLVSGVTGIPFSSGAPREMASVAAAGMGSHPAIGALAKRGGAMIARHPVLSAAAAAGTIGLLGAGGRAMGKHKGVMVHKGMLLGHRRRRRMHVTNPKALRRAIRRANGFAKMARRVLRFTSPRPPKGRAVFRFHRKKK